MACYRPFALVVALVFYVASVANGLGLDEFYPFGRKSGDTRLHRGFHKLVNLSAPVLFNGEAHNNLYVISNGAISFNSPAPFSKHLTPQIFPNGHKLIDPYFTDLRTPRTRKVFYRETQEKQLLLLAGAEVHAGFANEREFEATKLFIATWLHVGQGNPVVNKSVSFQVVVISDGARTFTLFHYNSEVNEHHLPNSGTSSIFKLSQTSNVRIPGKWLYMISSRGVTEPDVTRNGAKYKMNDTPVRRSTPDSCGENEIECSKDAVCKKTPLECCVCNTGYYGNGKMCLKSGQTVHLRGKLSGSINDISVDGIRFSVFADVFFSKTTFVALDRVSPLSGFVLRVFTPMVSTLGFLFAHLGRSSVNGFSFLGDNFSRRSQVTFETGEVANIRETMLGKSDSGFYSFKIEINGKIPVFDRKKDIQFDDYVHTYRYDRLGIMSGYYRATFNVDETKHKINVVEVLEFDEEEGCMNIGSSKMAVSEQRSAYNASTGVLNFALKAEMQDEEACGKGNRKCHRQAKCVVKNGVEFCDCNLGFHGDGYSCEDVDECLLNIHDCSSNAICRNTLGSYSCQCRDGFQGGGRICQKEEGRCGDEAKECHFLAQCVIEKGVEICECNVGYIGNGEFCQDADECDLGIDQCSVNADCINTPGSYECRCKVGYTGDGQTCLGIQIGSGDECTPDGLQCDPTEDCIEGKCQCRNGFLHDGSTCKDADECILGVHTCDKTASCSNTVGSFKCTCRKGYTGDGYKCVPAVTTVPLTGCHGKKCHDDGSCDRSGKIPVCKCNQGYTGDGVACQDVDECDTGDSRCHGYAICTNTIGSYTCQCRPGYKGDGRQCVYDDPCKDLSCSSNARCIIRDDSPMCQCYSGYYGSGRSCKDYNECEAERDTCDQNAKCVNTPGSYKCFCLPGYNGDGFSCKSDGSCGGRKCHRNAKCVEVDGVKRCQCEQGFIGSGLICLDIDECSNTTLIECPQFSHCFNTFGSYRCQCDTGYQSNGVECKPVCLRCLNGGQCLKSGCLCREGYSGERCQWVGDEFLVFTQGSTMQRLSLPPRQNTIGILLQTTRGLLVALDFDHMNKMIYFTDVARKAIWRVGFNGTGIEKIISNGLASPEGIAVDYVGGNLYWTDSMFDRVEVSKLDGSDRKVLFSTRLINPRSIVVHPEKGTMYWADWNRAAPKIEVAHMDGSSRRVFVQQKMGLPNGLALDRRNDELCWTDAMHGSISCADLNEGKSQDIYSAARYPFGLTSFGQYLIWTDWDARSIQLYDRQTFKLQPAIKSVRGSTGAFYEIKAVQKPEDIDSHECSKNNGGCSNLCLPKPDGRTCACADSFHLVSREKSLKLKLKTLGSGSGSGYGIANRGGWSGSGSGSGPGSGSDSGIIPQSTPVPSLNSTVINSTGTVCVDEENYKLIRNLL